jgi:hypothetical protein
MLEAGPGRFEGGMPPESTPRSRKPGPTATRELVDLVQKGLLVPGGAGRSRRYELTIPGWEWVPLQDKKK